MNGNQKKFNVCCFKKIKMKCEHILNFVSGTFRLENGRIEWNKKKQKPFH